MRWFFGQTYLRFIFLALFAVSLESGVYALESENTNSGQIVKPREIVQDINTYILDAYKAQGDKILKNLDISLKKTMPKSADQIDAYRRLRSALISNIQQAKEANMSDTRRGLVVAYLNYLIDQITLRISELQEL